MVRVGGGRAGRPHHIEPAAHALILSNTWLVHGRDRDLLVDTGNGLAMLRPFVDSDIDAYLATMRRLRDLPVRIVHAGHDPSMDRRTMVARCTGYLERRAERRSD